MITIISGTNRKNSRTQIIARHYASILAQKQIPFQYLSLEDKNIYERNETIIALEASYLIPATKYIFLLPEYNGSYPGILKLFLDHTDVNKVWKDKYALLVGIAQGRGGNVRGLDHFTNVLNYLGVTVHPDKLHISGVSHYISNDTITSESLISDIALHLQGFLSKMTGK